MEKKLECGVVNDGPQSEFRFPRGSEKRTGYRGVFRKSTIIPAVVVEKN